MIRKRSHNTPPTEILQQASITGVGGIDATKPITANTVLDKAINFDVDTDGTLILRKPLLIKDNFSSLTNENESIVLVKYMYDKKHKLIILKNTEEEEETPRYRLIIWKDSSWLEYTLRFSDVNNVQVDKILSSEYENLVFPFWNLSEPQVFNTNSGTIIGNCTIDLTDSIFEAEETPDVGPSHASIYDLNLIEVSKAKQAPRYIRIFFETTSKRWIVEVINPEINILNEEEQFTLNPNTTLDTSYALRDNYNSSIPSIKSVVAYAGVLFQNEKLVFNPDLKATEIISYSTEYSSPVANPTYWNPNSYNIETTANPSISVTRNEPITPRIRHVFEAPRIPRNAIKDIEVSFESTGTVTVNIAGLPLNTPKNISTSETILLSGVFTDNHVEEIITRFKYNAQWDDYLGIVDIVESGSTFLEVCLEYNGTRTYNYVDQNAWTDWLNCGFKTTIKVTLKDDTFKIFERKFGQIY